MFSFYSILLVSIDKADMSKKYEEYKSKMCKWYT